MTGLIKNIQANVAESYYPQAYTIFLLTLLFMTFLTECACKMCSILQVNIEFSKDF